MLCATDDRRIARAVDDLVEVVVDDAPFRSGSDRVAAAARELSGQQVLNVQGDEALVDATVIGAALCALHSCDIGTVAARHARPEVLAHRDTVKVHQRDGRALSFSRATSRGRQVQGATHGELAHIGIYAYTAESLERFAALPSTPGEREAQLEQLRALEHGWRIGVEIVDVALGAINRPSDIARVERQLEHEHVAIRFAGPAGPGAAAS